MRIPLFSRRREWLYRSLGNPAVRYLPLNGNIPRTLSLLLLFNINILLSSCHASFVMRSCQGRKVHTLPLTHPHTNIIFDVLQVLVSKPKYCLIRGRPLPRLQNYAADTDRLRIRSIVCILLLPPDDTERPWQAIWPALGDILPCHFFRNSFSQSPSIRTFVPYFRSWLAFCPHWYVVEEPDKMNKVEWV